MITESNPCDFAGVLCPADLYSRCAIRPESERLETALYLNSTPGTKNHDEQKEQLANLNTDMCELEMTVGRKTWADGITSDESVLVAATKKND